ncbi:MAG: hypothetical protein VB934_16505, partial [Polyangiaceae bacterium]
HLVPALTEHNRYVVPTASLIERVGTTEEKLKAVVQLIHRAEVVGSDAWRTTQLPVMQRLHRAPPKTSGWGRLWLDRWQERHLVRIYDALDVLSGDAVYTHCNAVARDDQKRPAERRLAVRLLFLKGKAELRQRNPWSMPRENTPPTTPGTLPVANNAPSGPAHEPVSLVEGELVDFDHIVDQLRPQFELCYRHALHQVGRFGAWITLVATIDHEGQVQDVRAKGDGSEPPMIMNCLRSVLSHAHFVPPSTPTATLSVPLTFTVPVANTPTDAGTTKSIVPTKAGVAFSRVNIMSLMRNGWGVSR